VKSSSIKSPLTPLCQRGEDEGLIARKMTDISDCLIAFRFWLNSAFRSGLPIFLSQNPKGLAPKCETQIPI